MSAGLYTHTTRTTGTVLTAAIYNADHQNHITNQNPSMTGAYSDTVGQMQTITNPGTPGSESLAISLAGELERIRFMLKAITGNAQWYGTPAATLAGLAGAGVPDNAVTNLKLADMAAWTIKMRNNAASGDPQDVAASAITDEAAPALADNLLLFKSADGAIRKSTGTALQSLFATQVPMVPPQGRLSLQSGSPIITSGLSGQTTIRYHPYIGIYVPLWNGSTFINTVLPGELTQATTDNTKSPAAVANNNNYDLFVWNDAGTVRCTRGPAWSGAFTRGAGAGTTELVRVAGIFLNAQNITNGPVAQRGTYVGTIAIDGTGGCTVTFGGAGAGGTAPIIGLWNAYNRVDIDVQNVDNTNTWTYNSATYRIKNNNANNAIQAIIGLSEDFFCVENETFSGTATDGCGGLIGVGRAGIGVNSTSVDSAQTKGRSGASSGHNIGGTSGISGSYNN